VSKWTSLYAVEEETAEPNDEGMGLDFEDARANELGDALLFPRGALNLNAGGLLAGARVGAELEESEDEESGSETDSTDLEPRLRFGGRPSQSDDSDDSDGGHNNPGHGAGGGDAGDAGIDKGSGDNGQGQQRERDLPRDGVPRNDAQGHSRGGKNLDRTSFPRAESAEPTSTEFGLADWSRPLPTVQQSQGWESAASREPIMPSVPPVHASQFRHNPPLHSSSYSPLESPRSGSTWASISDQDSPPYKSSAPAPQSWMLPRYRWASISDRDSRLTDRDYRRLGDRDSRLSDRDSRLSDRDSRLTGRDSRLTDRDSRLTDRDPQLTDRDSRLTDRDSRLSNRDSRLGNRDSRLGDRDSRLSDRDSRLTGRDSRLTDRDSRLTDRDSLLTDQDSRLTDRDSRLTDRDSRLSNRDASANFANPSYDLNTFVSNDSEITSRPTFSSIYSRTSSSVPAARATTLPPIDFLFPYDDDDDPLSSYQTSAPVFNPPASTFLLQNVGVVAKPAEEIVAEEFVRGLLVFQKSDGCFAFNEKTVKTILGPSFLGVVTGLKAKLDVFDTIVTIALVALLEEQFRICQALWVLMVRKAKDYISACSLGPNEDVLMQEARNRIKSIPSVMQEIKNVENAVATAIELEIAPIV